MRKVNIIKNIATSRTSPIKKKGEMTAQCYSMTLGFLIDIDGERHVVSKDELVELVIEDDVEMVNFYVTPFKNCSFTVAACEGTKSFHDPTMSISRGDISRMIADGKIDARISPKMESVVKVKKSGGRGGKKHPARDPEDLKRQLREILEKKKADAALKEAQEK